MDDQRLGATVRLLRRRRGWTQADLAGTSDVSRGLVSLVERGLFESVTFGAFRRVAASLNLRLDQVPRWRGGEVDRMLSRRHSLMHESFAQHIRGFGGWIFRPEVSYSIYGERGVIDMLAWHDARSMILVVEFKTDLIDVNELVGSMDRRRRLAIQIGRDQGWHPVAASALVVLAGSRTNRRRVAEHRTILRTAFPADGRHLAGWLREPREPVSMLAMWPNATHGASGPAGHRFAESASPNPRAAAAPPRTSRASTDMVSATGVPAEAS